MKTTYTEEAVADIVDAITYLNERNPAAAVNLDAEIARCIERLAAQEFGGPLSRLQSGALVRSWAVTGRPFTYQEIPLDLIRQRMGEDTATMYAWFDRVARRLI